MDNVKYNQLSDQLRKEVRQALPENGQVIWFESVRPKSRGTTVLSYDRIFDPYANDGQGEHVDIAYIIGQEPAKGPTGTPRPIIGRIQFNRQSQGRIGIRGGNRSEEQMFEFLYLTNQLKNNFDKPWFVAGKSPVCVMKEPAKSAEQELEFYDLIAIAHEAVRRMSESKLRELAIGLDMKGINRHSDPTEIKVRLMKIANKDPRKITSLDRDVNLAMKILIKKAEKFGVIKHDNALSMYVWPDSGDQICLIPPGKGSIETLSGYLQGRGIETYKFIKKLVEEKEDAKDTLPPDLGKKEKTGGRQKGTPNKVKEQVEA